MRRAALLALSLIPLAASPSRAQSAPTEAHAQEIQQQIRDWIVTSLGPDIKIASNLISVTAEGDHYAFAAPFGNGPDAPVATAAATPSADGRWAIDNIRVPSPSRIHVDLPGKAPGTTTPSPSHLTTYALRIGQQSGQMMLDPSFATPTTSTSTMQNLDMNTEDAPVAQRTHVDRASTSLVAQPAAPGRINVAVQSSMEGYKLDSELPNASGMFSLGMGQLTFASNMENVSRERLFEVVRAVGKLASLAPSQGSTPTEAQVAEAKALAAGLVPIVTDLTTGMTLDEKVDNISFATGGMEGALRTFKIGFGGRGNDGLLQAHLDLAAEGLTLPELGLGSKVGLIPTKVSLRPMLSGVPTDAVVKLLQTASEGGSPAPDDIAALFARGNVVAGLDSLVIDVAGAEMLAQGKVTVTSPSDISGSGQVSMTNLDQLQQRIAAEPEMASAVPAIIFLKGIGRVEQNRMVWDITYQAGHLLVNKQDMTMLMGGAGDQPARPDATPQTAPQQTPGVQEGHRTLRRRP